MIWEAILEACGWPGSAEPVGARKSTQTATGKSASEQFDNGPQRTPAAAWRPPTEALSEAQPEDSAVFRGPGQYEDLQAQP